MADVELPELPQAFEGYPYSRKLDAYLRALAIVPVADLRAHLTEGHVEEALILATCLGLRPDEHVQAQFDRLLSQLPRRTGKHRRNVGRPLP